MIDFLVIVLPSLLVALCALFGALHEFATRIGCWYTEPMTVG
jgi:hypothetical protein